MEAIFNVVLPVFAIIGCGYLAGRFRILGDDSTEALNAFVAMHDREALLEAARAAEGRIAAGDARPLEGVPLGVKDLEDTVGLPNTQGSRIHASPR